MKLKCLGILAAGLALNLSLSAAEELKTDKDKISYAIGMDIGRNITNNQVDINIDALAAGVKAMVSGAKPQLSDEQFKDAMGILRSNMQARMADRMKEQQASQKVAGEKNKKDGEAFLAENKKKPGIKTTDSGLQYEVLTMGTGPKPTTMDTVICHYRGTLTDGKEFDSSYKRGEPSEFPVTGVIKGWTEALQLMPVGSKWKLYIPSEIAYGERGQGRDIGPNSVLIFEIELVGIKGKDAKPEEKK